jgi:hypothetical protein
MENQLTPTVEHISCGVVIVNAVLGGMNLLLATWLGHDRRRADLHRRRDHSLVMRRLDRMEDRCPVAQQERERESGN